MIAGTKVRNQKNVETKSIKVMPVLVGALGSTSNKLKNCRELGVVISCRKQHY